MVFLYLYFKQTVGVEDEAIVRRWKNSLMYPTTHKTKFVFATGQIFDKVLQMIY